MGTLSYANWLFENRSKEVDLKIKVRNFMPFHHVWFCSLYLTTILDRNVIWGFMYSLCLCLLYDRKCSS